MKFLIFSIFFIFLFACKETAPNEKLKSKVLILQPLAFRNFELLQEIQKEIEEKYSIKVYIAKNLPLPENSITTYKGHRYNASVLLDYLQKIKVDSVDYLLGVTNQDICFTKRDENGKILQPEYKYRDFGIFGLGQKPGVSSVISEKRLQAHKALTTERMKKVALHEIGHNLGLDHCEQSENCVMRSAAEKISTLDKVKLELCKECKKRIS